MPQVSCSDMSVKVWSGPDEDNEMRFSIRVNAENHSDVPIKVSVSLQAVDAEGFEVTTTSVKGELAARETKSLSHRTFHDANEFEQISQWQVSSFYVSEPD